MKGGAAGLQDKKENNDKLLHLIAAYQTPLTRMAFYFLNDQMLSEDAVQETFLKIYKNIHLCPSPDLEKAWVYKIAVNTVRDMLRRISVRMKYLKIKPPLAMFASSPIETDIIALHTEIGCLPRKMKEVILLYYYQDFSVNEIAAILNLSQSSVSGRLKRARDTLSKRLKGDESI